MWSYFIQKKQHIINVPQTLYAAFINWTERWVKNQETLPADPAQPWKEYVCPWVSYFPSLNLFRFYNIKEWKVFEYSKPGFKVLNEKREALEITEELHRCTFKTSSFYKDFFLIWMGKLSWVPTWLLEVSEYACYSMFHMLTTYSREISKSQDY